MPISDYDILKVRDPVIFSSRCQQGPGTQEVSTGWNKILDCQEDDLGNT